MLTERTPSTLLANALRRQDFSPETIDEDVVRMLIGDAVLFTQALSLNRVDMMYGQRDGDAFGLESATRGYCETACVNAAYFLHQRDVERRIGRMFLLVSTRNKGLQGIFTGEFGRFSWLFHAYLCIECRATHRWFAISPANYREHLEAQSANYVIETDDVERVPQLIREKNGGIWPSNLSRALEAYQDVRTTEKKWDDPSAVISCVRHLSIFSVTSIGMGKQNTGFEDRLAYTTLVNDDQSLVDIDRLI